MNFLQEIFKNKWVRFIFFLLVCLIILLIFYKLGHVIGLFVTSLILAYIFDPAVDRFQKVFRNRSLSVAVLTLFIIVLICFFWFIMIPAFFIETTKLASDMPEYINRISNSVVPYFDNTLGRFGISVPKTFDDLINLIKANESFLRDLGSRIYLPLLKFFQKTFSSIMNLILSLLSVVVVPVAWFYLVRDFDEIKIKVLEIVPIKWRPTLVRHAKEVDFVVSNFLRGQITVCLILGLLYGIGMQFVAQVPMGFFLGLFSGLIAFVPYLGFIFGISAGLILSLLKYGDVLHPVLVLVVFGVVQALDSTVITPKIIGDKLGMNPVIIIFAILVGGELFGFIGILIAVPVAAVLKVFILEGVEYYKKSEYFLENDLK